jgi:LCP family protein required for cell wall assembly
MATGDGPDEGRAGGAGRVPEYTRYRARPRWLPGGRGGGDGALGALRGDGPGHRGPRRPVTGGRFVRWLAAAIAAWIALSLALFLVSAQIQQGKTSDEADRALAGGFPLTAKTTTLVLGSDARPKGSREPGAQPIGAPSRSDTILLIRSGAGASARLSIPRDTIVDIPGHGRDKINAAYAIGGAALAIQTVERFLGIQVNHLVEVDFANFPKLIDAMGGIDYTGGCVVSRINGGSRNGGYTLRLRRGTTHIDGKQALALARTRKNACNRREDDRTRARRQQKIFSAMKSRLLSPGTFVRLPWVSWQAPRAIRSDMSGPSLLGLFASLAVGGSPATRVLVGVPQGNGLVVPETEKRREVRRFSDG